MQLSLDCKYYRGDRPCEFKSKCKCKHYEPMGKRILIIKTGALGDVVRTISIVQTLKEVYPESYLVWITDPKAIPLLRYHPDIDKIVPFDVGGILEVSVQRFDLLISLDKEPGPAALSQKVSADDKRGIGLSEFGTIYPMNPECEPYFELGLDNNLKFYENQKSYHQLIHEAVGLPYIRRSYRIYCDEGVLQEVRTEFDAIRSKYSGKLGIVGLNTGSGKVFANKSLPREKWVELIERLSDDGFLPLLLGGPGEKEKNAWIENHSPADIINTDTQNSLERFVAIVDQCDIVVTGDTLGLHVAIGRSVPVVAIFGPTCEQEIDLFGLGRKIVAPVDCRPCYKRKCDFIPSCMDAISVDCIMEEIRSLRDEVVVCNS